ncbi:aminotransferase class V-fold PLP-dependent enzyme, partial [Campylobacter jejuni]|nr:aminotransferase class V-fold PLP-dependent enzyme [Campylobacter jejuni]HED4714886.1 aminotransferase class V-fold PLP-dependent enzyme [Campylobacter jejuni]
AGPYGHDLLGLKDNQKLKTKPGWLRISLHYTHEKEDIDYFFNALNKTIIKLSH